MLHIIKKFTQLLGIDRAILFVLLARGWAMCSGLLTVVFLTRYLSPEMQGYYYTFYSLIALNFFFELGINFSIIQFASHEMTQLNWMPDGTLSGNAASKRRLQSLMHFALKWYSVAGVVMLVVLLPAGLMFFKSAASAGVDVPSVSAPWFWLVFFTALNLSLGATLAVLDGCGRLADVAVLRLWQSLLSVLAVWLVLAMGGNLYALVANNVVLVAVGFFWVWLKYRSFYKDFYTFKVNLPGISWRTELWPFQWRIALSCMSGYFISQLYTPLLFATHGPVVAGQMGMSMQLVTALNSVALAWITTKAPTFGNLIATRQRRALDALFFRGLTQSLVLLILGVIGVISIFYYLSIIGSAYASRVLQPHLLVILGFACVFNHIVRAEADYLRAHKKEPFMALYVLLGTVTATLAWFLIPAFGSAGAVYSFALPSLFVGLGGGTLMFFFKRREYARW